MWCIWLVTAVNEEGKPRDITLYDTAGAAMVQGTGKKRA